MTRAGEPQPALGAAVKQLREQRGSTQEALAYEAGITTGTLSQLERGISNPSWGTLKAVAGALGVSMVELAKLTAKFEQ
ncbi:MAG TPA: helix-turn-helix transcriptional regulator [Solirubrobacterales bacterium]